MVPLLYLILFHHRILPLYYNHVSHPCIPTSDQYNILDEKEVYILNGFLQKVEEFLHEESLFILSPTFLLFYYKF